MSALDDLMAAAHGGPIPGGCDSCDAESRVEEVAPNVFVTSVAHDNNCPYYRVHVGRRAN
ncbi:MAG: hypothetical protein WB565_00125 [Acidimicrobiales bacterium]